jgi:hypothetical protein
VTWCDEILGWHGEAEFESAERRASALDLVKGLPIETLLQAWRVVKRTRYTKRTSGVWFFDRYFDGLGKDNPDRACDFILASIANEDDDELVALIGEGKLLPQLLLRHGVSAELRLAPAAGGTQRMRWLLGSAYWLIKGQMSQEIQHTILPVADWMAWDTWRKARHKEIGDTQSLSIDELAAAWIEANDRSPIERNRDSLFDEVFHLCAEFARCDRMQGFELVLRVLSQTEETALLSLLAAGLLEDLICSEDSEILGKVEEAATRDARFRRLLSGVWYSRVAAATAARIDKARAGAAPF